MSRNIFALIALFVATAVSWSGAIAQPVASPSKRGVAVEIVNAWVQEPLGGAVVASAYMRIHNHGASADRLLSISTPRAGRTEMHQMSMEGSMMSMRPLPYGVTVPANGSFEFSPTGAHIMFNNMNGSYAVGQAIPLRLTFQHAGTINIAAPVRSMSAGMHH
jgi:periplasmic copper chaperone A